MADDGTAQHFEWLKAVAADRSLKPAAFKLAFLIGEHFNRETGKAFPGVDRLADLMNTDVRTVRRLIGQLKDAGHLKVGHRNGPNHTNLYERSTQDKSVLSNGIHSGQKCTHELPLRTFSTATQDISDTHSGQPAPLNPLRTTSELKSASRKVSDLDLKEEDLELVQCESAKGDAYRAYWRATGQPEPARSGRTGCYIRKLPKVIPVILAKERAA